MENEIKRLIEVNNEHLRMKGKLLQEIIDLKKELEAEEKNKQLIEHLQQRINQQNEQIVNHLLNKSMLSGQIEELKQNLSLMELQKENAFAEMERLKNIKWYNKLFGKR